MEVAGYYVTSTRVPNLFKIEAIFQGKTYIGLEEIQALIEQEKKRLEKIIPILF